jgi:hypothetical protein
VRLDADAAEKVKKGEILRVVMTSGETIEFSKEQPGRVQNDSITGTAIRITGELDQTFIEEIEKDKNGKILRMIVSIPLSEVEMIVVEKYDFTKSFLAALGIGAAVLLVVAVAIIEDGLRITLIPPQ